MTSSRKQSIAPTIPARRKLLRVSALLTAAPIVTACSVAAPNRIPAPKGFIQTPRVRSGESWRYALINRYNGEIINEVVAQVASVKPQLRIKLVDKNGKSLSDEIYDAAWNIRQEPIYNETLVFDHPVPLLPSRLAVGATQAAHTSYRLSGTGTPHSWRVQLTARHWERVTVPAGSFDALRIERQIHFEHHDTFRRGSRRDDTIWYAPSANRWVKREWTGFYREDSPRPFHLSIIGEDYQRLNRLSDRMAHRSRMAQGNPFGPHFSEEAEDAISWVMLEHLPAPVS